MKLSYKKILGTITGINIILMSDYAILKKLVIGEEVLKLIGLHIFILMCCYFGLKMVGGLIKSWIVAKNTNVEIKKHEGVKGE